MGLALVSADVCCAHYPLKSADAKLITVPLSILLGQIQPFSWSLDLGVVKTHLRFPQSQSFIPSWLWSEHYFERDNCARICFISRQNTFCLGDLRQKFPALKESFLCPVRIHMFSPWIVNGSFFGPVPYGFCELLFSNCYLFYPFPLWTKCSVCPRLTLKISEGRGGRLKILSYFWRLFFSGYPSSLKMLILFWFSF